MTTGTLLKKGKFDGKHWAAITKEILISVNKLSDSRWVAILDHIRTGLGEERKRLRIQFGPPPDANNDDNIGMVMADSNPIYHA